MITIYIGDVTDEVRQAAHAHDPAATLITADKTLGIKPGTYYTSLGDLQSLDCLHQVLREADNLHYVPPVRWSDDRDGHSDMQKWTEFYLRLISLDKQTISDESLHASSVALGLSDTRRHDDPQLWVAGCSITAGVGVRPEQTYGALLADRLGMPVSVLAAKGSSIEWARDQICRSDIRAGDIVIWGLTTWNRLVYYDHSRVMHVNISTYRKTKAMQEKVDLARLDDIDLLHRSVLSCYQARHFCQAAGAKIYFAGLLVNHELLPYLMDLPNMLQFYGKFGLDPLHMFPDLGDDGEHPGPRTHEWYADQLMHRINRDRTGDVGR